MAWPDIHRYEAYRALLIDAPLAMQAFAGAALALVPGWIALRGWLAIERPRWAHLLLAAVCGAALLVHTRLPVHLSAPDFDDFFVVDKFTGAVQEGWQNDKPLFTIWDYPYRLIESAAALEPLDRFKINGWFALVYVLLLGLLLERALTDRLGQRWPRFSRWLPWLAALHMGPLVLSHGIPYELACATWILTTSLVLDWMRTAAGAPSWPLLLGTLACARWMQANGHAATAMGWAPVYAHGVLVLRRWRAPIVPQVWAAALLVSAAIDMVSRQRLGGTVGRLPGEKLLEILPWGIVPISLALVGLWWVRRPQDGAFLRFVARTWTEPSGGHVWLAYLGAGAAIYFFANHETFGLVIPATRNVVWNMPWDFGVNHARYALFLYPSLVVLLALLLLSRGGALGLVILAAWAVAWNSPYVLTFYGGTAAAGMSVIGDHRTSLLPESTHRFLGSVLGDPTGRRLPGVGYRRNSRFLEAARALMPRLAGEPVVAYVPLSRDHGDHYLVRAVDPKKAVVGACAPWARQRPELPLVVSDHTLDVLIEDGGSRLIDAGAPYRGDVFVMRMAELPAEALDKWCGGRELAAYTKAPPVEEWR
jgi:hypothetical protein